MNMSSRRVRVLAAAIGACGAATLALTAGTSFAAQAGPAASSAVLYNCGTAQVKPSQFTVACADGNAYLTRLHWVSWQNVAFATGTEVINNCFPYCAAGKFYRFPVLVSAWRPEARPSHAGRYFTRMTVIYTGSLTRPHLKVSRTVTFPLTPQA